MTKTFGLKLFLIGLVSLNAFSNVFAAVSDQERSSPKYSYTYQGENFVYPGTSRTSASENDIFEKAAFACYNHFNKSNNYSEDDKLEIIDVCANPKKI